MRNHAGAARALPAVRATQRSRYAVSVLVVAMGLAVVTYRLTPAPIAPFVLAVMMATWYGGTGPGILAVGLSLLCVVAFTAAGQVQQALFFLAISAFVVSIVAEERRSARSLRRARDELQLVVDTMPTMAWTLSSDGRLEFVSQRWTRYTGLTPQQAIVDQGSTVHPDDIAPAVEEWRKALASGADYEGEMRLRRADGEYRRFLVRTVPLLDAEGSIVRWYGTSTDIEDRKRAEQALREGAERLQHLSRRLLEVQEEERRHLARELHDEFGQILAAVGLNLQAARNAAGDAAREHLDECAAMLRQAGERVRGLALDLRPAILETAGLDGTLRWLAKQHRERTGIDTQVIGEARRVKPDVAIACFRVAQEALTNVVRHAAARRVWIELTVEGCTLEIAIRDDGTGFDVTSTARDAPGLGHLGLLGMSERVEILGGKLRIDSELGRGSTIRVAIPNALLDPGQ